MREDQRSFVLQKLGEGDSVVLGLLSGCGNIRDKAFWAKVMSVACCNRSSLLVNYVSSILFDTHGQVFLSEVANEVVYGYSLLTIMNYKGNEEILRIYNHYATQEDKDHDFLVIIDRLNKQANAAITPSKSYGFFNMLKFLGIFGSSQRDPCEGKIEPVLSSRTIGKKTS